MNQNDRQALLSERLTNGLTKHVGQVIRSVRYRTLENEISGIDQDDEQFFFDGEIYLDFGSETLVIIWDEKAGWPDYFSIYAGKSPLIFSDAKMDWWDAGKQDVWKPCLDTTLNDVCVYEQFETPHMIELEFEYQSVSIADGSETQFANGDDVLVRDRDHINLSEWKKMWSYEKRP